MSHKISCHPEFQQTGALRRFGGMRDLLLHSRTNIKKMCIKIRKNKGRE
jgi:hypothetical protein